MDEKQLFDLAELVHINPQEAYTELRRLSSLYPDNLMLLYNSTALLVDLGCNLSNKKLVEIGIKMGLKNLENPSFSELTTKLYYDIANCYYSLYNIDRDVNKDYKRAPNDLNLENAKKYFRLAEAGGWGSPKQVDCMVNYANCLSALGRTYEAIELYYRALEIEPNHSMALSQIGIELEYYVFVSDNPFFLSYVNEYLTKALIQWSLLKDNIGTNENKVVQQCKDALRRVREQPQHKYRDAYKKDFLNDWSDDQIAFLAFSTSNRLMLNFSFETSIQNNECKDSINIRAVKSATTESDFMRHTRLINCLKDDYVVSRLTLYEAINDYDKFDKIDAINLLSENNDNAVHGIRAAKLKLAFSSSFNVLDKIALFINSYLKLNQKEGGVTFFNVWYKNYNSKSDTNVLHPAVEGIDNVPLFALLDIAKDFLPSGEYYHLRNKRNHITHRYLIPHHQSDGWREDIDSKEYHVDYYQLYNDTLQLLKAVKSALIYLIAFISFEERRKFSFDNESDILVNNTHVKAFLHSAITYRNNQISTDA
jgi:tetratricopeptide (TPR) repeat protein